MSGIFPPAERVWVRSFPEGVPPDIEVPLEPYTKAIENVAEQKPNNIAIIFLGEKYTYKTVKGDFLRFARALADLGVKNGDRVAIYLPNSPQFVSAYLGALRIGAVAVPMHPLYTPSEIKYVLNDSGAETIICLDLNHKNVSEVKDETQLRNIIVTNISDSLPAFKRVLGKALKKIPSAKVPKESHVKEFRELLSRASPNPSEPSISPKEDLACLQYTGGTTGAPKGVMLTHYNILADRVISHAMISPFIEDGREVMVAILPFFHIYGQVVLLGGGLAYGNALIVHPRFDLERLLDSIERHRATMFFGIPTLYNALLNHAKFKDYSLDSVKYYISGADVLPTEVGREWERATGKPIIQGYGLSETSPVTHLNPFSKNKVGSFGVPISNTYAALMDPDGIKIVPSGGSVGEVVVKGPQVMKGYWNKPEETGKAFVMAGGEVWLRTGDLAWIDDGGYFYFVERIKDAIKHKGYLVAAAEVEGVLYNHPAVKEAGVVGVPDPEVGERIKAFVVLKEGHRGVTIQELIAWCRERLAPHKSPEFIEFKDSLPKSAVGKVLRRELRAQALAK